MARKPTSAYIAACVEKDHEQPFCTAANSGRFRPGQICNWATGRRVRLSKEEQKSLTRPIQSYGMFNRPLRAPFRLGTRASMSGALAIHPRAVGKLHRVIICRELGDSHQVIKSKPGGTDQRRKKQNDREDFLSSQNKAGSAPLRLGHHHQTLRPLPFLHGARPAVQWHGPCVSDQEYSWPH